MNYNLEIQKLLLDVDKNEDIGDKLILLKQAINIADKQNDIDWGIDLRNMIIRYEGYLAKKEESYAAFAWLLNTSDSDNELIDEQEMLFNYAWMISVAFCNPDISLPQLEYMVEDYRQRLAEAGFSRRSYYEVMIDWSLFIGDVESLRNYQQLRNAEPSSLMASFSEELTDVCIELLSGNLDTAIMLSEKYIAENSSNHGAVLSTYGQLVYYLNKSRDARAANYFEKMKYLFASMKKYPYMLFELVLMMYYASRNSSQDAWNLFEQYAVWEMDANGYLQFDFSLSVLPLFKKGGHREMILNPKLPYYREDNTYDLSQLYTYYYTKALEKADEFDRRNGNKYFTLQIEWHVKD